MQEQKLYELWCSKQLEDIDLLNELDSIKNSETEIYDRFYRSLEFGTGGLRGVLGAGTNRMNIYTVRQATQGMADHLKRLSDAPSAAISYDSRIKSELFAREAACVLAANGIKVYIYPQLMPTPMLSFAVRHLKCDAGIMVTASHNPAKYNGYKAYGSDGGQLANEAADIITECISKVDIFGTGYIPFAEGVATGIIEYIGDDVTEAFLAEVKKQRINPEVCEQAALGVAYTPLNGAGNLPVREILERTGVYNVDVVPEQENPDGNFPTCSYPNPEIKETMELACKLCLELDYDLALATDPDADRVGIVVNQGGEMVFLSGNDVGVLLLDYICANRIALGTMPKNPVAVTTIVSTKLAARIAQKYGVELRSVLTGFKFIGEQIYMLEEKGEAERFIFGFEESYGYLAGSYVRDKDSVVAAMLICEMASYYKLKGKTLLDVLHSIYEEHGSYIDAIDNFGFEGAAGMQKMQDIMSALRQSPPREIAGKTVEEVADYQLSQRAQNGKTAPIALPKSNVLEYVLEGGASLIVRPSGTEPKIKFYYSVRAQDQKAAQALLAAMRADAQNFVK